MSTNDLAAIEFVDYTTQLTDNTTLTRLHLEIALFSSQHIHSGQEI